MAFFDRTNSFGDGSFYSRTNDADIGAAQAFGDIGSAATLATNATVASQAIVILADPLYLGHGSILAPENFIGVPVAGATVRYPTNNEFTVQADGTCWANVNSGSYICHYDEGSGEVEFTITLDNHIDAWGDLLSASSVIPLASAIGGVSATASGDIGTATNLAPGGDAYPAEIATGDLGVALSVAPAGFVTVPSFPGDALGDIGLATAVSLLGGAVGAALGLGDIGTGVATSVDGQGNETGVGLAFGEIGVALAVTIDARGFAQWGRVDKNVTIWTRVN